MQGCKVSILVTFYNQIGCVDRALESVFAQVADFPFEVIVGDDGSTDGTWEAVQRWVQRYPDTVRCIRMSRDDGVTGSIMRASRNRLRLTGESKGEYLVYLDGDDYFPNARKLAMQVDALDSSPDCGSCAHNYEYVDEAGCRQSTGYPESDDDVTVSFERYWSAGYLPASCFMFRRPSAAVLDRANGIGFDDNIIVYLLARGGKIRYFGIPMFSYVQQGNSSWNSMDIVERVLVNQRDYLFEKGFWPDDAYASKVRHSLECIALATFSKARLDEYHSYVERIGLLDNPDFSDLWTDLVSEHFPRRLRRRMSLLFDCSIPACKKLFMRARCFGGSQ